MAKDNLKGRRILILGGNALSSDIVKEAKKMGLYTIVTDWNTLDVSPAKKIADEHWNISLMEYDLLADKIKSNNIEGIITGFTDSYLLPYQHLCEITGLPCYATAEQFEQTLNKALFKKMCRDNNVPVVPEYDISTFDKQVISSSNKIVIKPVDNSGSRGICICSKPKYFENMLNYSLSFSKKKEVVLERYMECDDVSLEYKIQDGEVVLSSICDRYIYKTKEAGSVTSKLIYPSKYILSYLKDADLKVRKMFQNMGFKNGVLFMQAFVENEQFYFYEMGYRLSGGRHYIFTDNQNKTNATKELIHFAITGKMSDYSLVAKSNPIFKSVCCQLSILCKSDTIDKIIGKDEISKIYEIIDASYYYDEGDTIGEEGTTAQIFSRFHIVAQNESNLMDVFSKIKHTLSVRNKDGKDIIIDFIK